jgi:hypothetical protein
MMSDLTYRLRNGFGSICGRASQVDGYQTISNEAADKIEELEEIIRGRDELINNAVSSRIAELEKERDELKIQVEVLTQSDKQNYELYSELLFSPDEPPENLQLYNFTQQSKGAMDYIEWGRINIDAEYCEFEDCAREYGELLIAGKLPIAKSLKEQDNG